VTSIVGRFLEHSRIYYFRNAGKEEIYLGSADLMPRNIDRRVETLYPVEDPLLVQFVKEQILAIYMAEGPKARQMAGDGSYSRIRSAGDSKNAQNWFLEQTKALKKPR